MMVGLILMNVSSCRMSVSPPNTSTMIAVTSGMIGKMARQRIGGAERRSTATMKVAGGGENAVAGIGEEEQDQRPEVESELEGRVELRFCRGGHGETSSSRAKSMIRKSGNRFSDKIMLH